METIEYGNAKHDSFLVTAAHLAPKVGVPCHNETVLIKRNLDGITSFSTLEILMMIRDFH
jgi:hypothetical protein